MSYTKQDARKSYDALKNWSDDDFEIAESNWVDAVHNWKDDPGNECEGSDEDFAHGIEPYSSEFLDWCCES